MDEGLWCKKQKRSWIGPGGLAGGRKAFHCPAGTDVLESKGRPRWRLDEVEGWRPRSGRLVFL